MQVVTQVAPLAPGTQVPKAICVAVAVDVGNGEPYKCFAYRVQLPVDGAALFAKSFGNHLVPNS